MHTEYEATFTNINKEALRKQLHDLGATLLKKEFLQKRVNFNLPTGHEISNAWLRVRDEQDKITLSFKKVDEGNIEGQKEIELTINNFENAVLLLETLGCEKKAYQESKREMWDLEGVQITLDEWPFLEPFLEIEAVSEAKVKEAAKKLQLDYSKALFCAIDALYMEKYNIARDIINNQTARIVFGENNPFLK